MFRNSNAPISVKRGSCCFSPIILYTDNTRENVNLIYARIFMRPVSYFKSVLIVSDELI